MRDLLEQVHPLLMIPMHFFGPPALERFLARMNGRYPITESKSPSVALSRAMLPKTTEILVLPGF